MQSVRDEHGTLRAELEGLRERSNQNALDHAAAVDEVIRLRAIIRAKLPPAKWRLLEVLIGVYPTPLSKDDLAARAGARDTSGAYFNNLGSLRSLGLLDYPSPGQVVACPVLFLDGR